MVTVVLALAAHPDDIEFMMAGTLLRLRRAGCRLHYCNLANGCCGYRGQAPEEVARTREGEAREAARGMDAVFHASLFNDLEIFYHEDAVRRVSAVFRAAAPNILLLPSTDDYMEDHVNTARLGVTAAFSRGMDNWHTIPPYPPVRGECAVYHAMPFGLRDGVGRRVRAGGYVDISPELERKRALLACHRSQLAWLDQSQGMDSYLLRMQELSAQMGELSGRFAYAEGWTRHNPSGFCGADCDPLRELLGEDWARDEVFQRSLELA